MHNKNQWRQYIPTKPAKPAPSLWQRLRGAASVAVSAVRSAGARVVALVTRKATGARAALSRVAHKATIHRPWILTRDGVKHVAQMVHAGNRAAAVRVNNWFRYQKKYARKASSWTKTTWHRVVCPFLRVRVVALGIGAVVIGLAVAPIATLTVLAGCGVTLVGFSRLIEYLEGSVRLSARAALRVIEVAAQVLRVAAYVAAGVAVLVISAASAAFAVTEILELVLRYLDVRLAVSVATLAFFVLTASWGLVLAEIAWLALIHERKTSSRAMRVDFEERQAIPLIRVDAERAWNGDETAGIVSGTAEPLATDEEMQETMDMIDEANEDVVQTAQVTKCMGCDLDDASPRFGFGNMTSLCSQCFEYLAEDELVSAADRGEVSAKDVAAAVRAGISVPAYVVVVTGARLRSTRINLDIEDITCRTQARALSEKDPSKIHWVETGWWFDGRGGRRARRWHGFVSGRIAATVEYQHEKDSRGFYFVVEGDSWTSSCFKTLAGAQDAAADEISDRCRAAELQAPPRGLGGMIVETLLAGVTS